DLRIGSKHVAFECDERFRRAAGSRDPHDGSSDAEDDSIVRAPAQAVRILRLTGLTDSRGPPSSHRDAAQPSRRPKRKRLPVGRERQIEDSRWKIGYGKDPSRAAADGLQPD